MGFYSELKKITQVRCVCGIGCKEHKDCVSESVFSKHTAYKAKASTLPHQHYTLTV